LATSSLAHLAPAEAVEQVALVNYIARREHLDARQVVEALPSN